MLLIISVDGSITSDELGCLPTTYYEGQLLRLDTIRVVKKQLSGMEGCVDASDPVVEHKTLTLGSAYLFQSE